MEQKFELEIQRQSKKQRRRKLWAKVLGMMACVVVFCTTYALILPAITQESEVFCGMEAHTHTEECYEEVLICGQEAGEVHTHTAECYTQQKTLTCTLEETEGHTHTEECIVTERALTCGQEETEGHTHSEGCYDEAGELICGLAETEGHTHSDACYTETTTYVCGLEETEGHTHSDDCYSVTETLTCGQEETQGHEHTEECYEKQLVCELTEHEHDLSCYSNPEADLETAADWEATVPDQLSGEYAVDILAVAKSQLGYQESEKNYIVTETGTTKGYTRYGAWYGDPYGDWCAMFVSFCLEYGQVADFPLDANCQNWIDTLQDLDAQTGSEDAHEYYVAAQGYEPVPGDIIFFNLDDSPASDHVGIVVTYTPATEHTTAQVKTIEGNSGNKVQYVTYEASDASIMGYGRLPEQYFYCGYTGHVHDSCNDCGLEEHIHTEACYSQSDGDEATLPTALSDEEETPTALSDEEESDTTRTDLSPYIGLDTNFTSAKYNPTTDQVEVSFHMTFSMTKLQIQSANYQFTYTLPTGIIIPDDMLGNTYDGRDTSGTKGFTYQFVNNGDGTYSVLVDFEQSYVDNHDNFSGYINFSAYAGEDAWKEGGGYEFKFNDDCTVTIPISEIEQEEDESIHYQIAVSKSNSGYDAATNKITYTITVDTTKGTPNPLNLTDILTAQGLEVDKVEVTSVVRINKDAWGNPIYNNGVADQTTLTKADSLSDANDTYTFSYDSTNGIQMTLPGLSEGSNNYGQKYTITYDVYLKEPAAGASYTVGNKVTVTGKENDTGETVTDSAETSTSIDKTLTLQKYGSYDKATDKIKWTITVNQNGNNIAGATLTDSMFTGQMVTVSPDSDYTLSDDTITFSGVDGDINNQTYTITYETNAPEVGEDGTVTVENTATVTPPSDGTSISVTASVTIDKNMKMVKTGTYDKATDTITWTITVNENGNDIAGAELTDTMFSSVQAESITVSPSQAGLTIVADETTGNVQKITFSALDSGTTNTQTYTITYTTPSGIDTNASGTVTNTATFDSKPGEEGGEITSGPGVWVDRTVDLDKSGGWYDSSTNQIYWKIDVNTNGNNIIGYTLTDDMLTQAVDGTLTIKISGWNSVDIDSTDNGFTVNKDDDGKITSISFTAIGDTSANTNQYTIEYYTEAKPGWESTTVTNTATLTPPDGTSITDEQTSSIPADGSVYKKCQGATSPDADGIISITWRTEINIPADGLPAGTVVTDTLADDGQWMDWLQIQKWGSILFAKQTDDENYIQDINYWWPLGESYTILFYATDGTTCTYDDIVSNSNGAQNKKFTKYEITFPNGVPADTYGGKTIYFEYDSYANVSSVTEEATYKNTVSVTPPDSTSKSGDASYTYKAPGVVKMDGDGKTGTTSIVTTDGSLTWKVRVRLSADCTTLTLTDSLPEGVTLTGLTFASQELTIGEDGSITGTLEGLTISNSSVTTGSDSKQTLSLTVTVPENDTAPDYFKANGEFYVVYTCKISDALLEAAQNAEDHKVGTFTNSVTVTADGTEFPSAEQTQEVTYTKPTSGLKTVTKDGAWNNDSRYLEYSILLNPDGMDLLPNSDTLTLTDELSYYIGDASIKFDVSLLPGSVVLYQAVQNEDGTWSRGAQVTDWSWSVATRTEYGTQFYSTITATIPDGTPLILEYAYAVWVPEGSSFDDGSSTYHGIYNKATLSGISGGYDETKFDVEWRDSDTSAGITADRAYIFYKVEEDCYGNRLPGAEFTLYDENGNDLFIYTTDSDGSFIIQWQSEGNGGYQSFVHNTLYYVQETKAPEGYLLPDAPTKFYFYFSDATDTEHTLDTSMLPENAVDLSVTAYTAYVENTKIPVTEITVNKQWFDAEGNEITSTKAGSITFDLYQIASTTSSGGSGESESGGGTGVSYQYTSNGSTVVESGTLSGIKVGSVVEVTVTMTYDCTYWQPTVTLTGMEPVNDGTWTHGSNSVYTRQATITEESIVVNVGDSAEKFSVSITKISDPESGDTDSGDTGDTDDDTSTEPAGTLYGTYTISNTDGWTWSRDDLPLSGTDEDGNTVNYTYYVVEQTVTNCTTAYENNGGIASGTITIKNTESDTPGVTLPETGGAGTSLYTMGGLLLMAASLLLYNKTKRRKEDSASS